MPNDQAVIAALEPHTTPARSQRMRRVLDTRSQHAAFVFEAMHDPHNFSAALRSLDAFSFQSIHLLQASDRLNVQANPGLHTNPAHDTQPNRPLYPQGAKAPSRGVSTGAERWLSVEKHSDAHALSQQLKEEGRRICVSCCTHQAIPLMQLDLSNPVALVFGNEHHGVSQTMQALADVHFWIPTLGFVESLNLSVSVAVCAFYLRHGVGYPPSQKPDPKHPHQTSPPLSSGEKNALYARWLKQSVKRSAAILERYTPQSDPP